MSLRPTVVLPSTALSVFVLATVGALFWVGCSPARIDRGSDSTEPDPTVLAVTTPPTDNSANYSARRAADVPSSGPDCDATQFGPTSTAPVGMPVEGPVTGSNTGPTTGSNTGPNDGNGCCATDRERPTKYVIVTPDGRVLFAEPPPICSPAETASATTTKVATPTTSASPALPTR